MSDYPYIDKIFGSMKLANVTPEETTMTNTNEFQPMLVIPQDDFKKNMAIDLSEFVKKLQGNDYVPWGVAIHYLREYNPELAVGFEVEPRSGQPYFIDGGGRGAYLLAYVFNKRTGQRTPSIFFPVRNNKRQASADVMMDTIGNQQQRAIAKVIAQETGIGWSLYSRIDESMLELEDGEVPSPSAASKKTPTPGVNKLTQDTLNKRHSFRF
mgnify:CR=1 FL=1